MTQLSMPRPHPGLHPINSDLGVLFVRVEWYAERAEARGWSFSLAEIMERFLYCVPQGRMQ